MHLCPMCLQRDLMEVLETVQFSLLGYERQPCIDFRLTMTGIDVRITKARCSKAAAAARFGIYADMVDAELYVGHEDVLLDSHPATCKYYSKTVRIGVGELLMPTTDVIMELQAETFTFKISKYQIRTAVLTLDGTVLASSCRSVNIHDGRTR